MIAPDTIVACASPPGRADRAVIRASGPASRELASCLTPAPAPRAACRCGLPLGGGELPVLAVFLPGPATFTGEDSLELVVPGNPHLVERVLDRCCASGGVRRAGPGEFSARAYLNGRLGLDQAEGVAALIAAHTAEDLGAAGRLARGETGAAYRGWADELTALLALVEAGIDFADQEDVVPIGPGALRERAAVLALAMRARAGGERAARAAGDRPLVVLAGEPDAGKSTLFNALLGRARSVAAGARGTTRDVLIEELHLDEAAGPGLAVLLADLPGLDAGAAGESAQAAQARALDALARADAVVHCDPHGRFGRSALPEGVPVLRVRTKADLPGRHAGDVEVCALDGWRVGAVRRGIADIALRAPGGSCVVALARHARELTAAAEHLDRLASIPGGGPGALDAPEVAAEHLRAALDRLGQVTGRVGADEVIGRVFATFCVGK